MIKQIIPILTLFLVISLPIAISDINEKQNINLLNIPMAGEKTISIDGCYHIDDSPAFKIVIDERSLFSGNNKRVKEKSEVKN